MHQIDQQIGMESVCAFVFWVAWSWECAYDMTCQRPQPFWQEFCECPSMPRKPREKIYPGVTTAHILAVLRAWVASERIECLIMGFQELIC